MSALDGDFAFVVFDCNNDELFYGRDPFGVRSLYVGTDTHGWHSLCIASEVKALTPVCDGPIAAVTPGTVTKVSLSTRSSHTSRFWVPAAPYIHKQPSSDDDNGNRDYYRQISKSLVSSVKKRMLSNRPIGCLLSGGLDSSVIAALVARNMKHPKALHTFSIGMEGGVDLKYAADVARHIGSTHHEIIVTEEELVDSIPELIGQIETYDVTTVRASCPMFSPSKKNKGDEGD